MAAPVHDPYEQPTALARRDTQTVTAPKSFPLRAVIEGHGDVLGPVCRSYGVDPEAVIAQLWVASQKQPDLLRATPTSLVSAVSFAISTGGVIGRDVNLLVFGTEATPHIHYKYEAELVVAAGGARSLDMNNVHKHDVFKEVKGSHPQLVHEMPPLGQDRGPIIGSYAIAYFGANVPPRWVTLPLEKIEKIRAKSKAWSKGPMPDWYGMKTAMHQVVKILPKNPKLAALLRNLQQASDVDDDEIVVTGPLEFAPDVGTAAEVPTSVNTETVPADDNTESGERDPALVAALDRVVNKQRLGDARNTGLAKIREWAGKKIATEGDDSGRLDSIIACCDLILEARERGEIAEPEKVAA